MSTLACLTLWSYLNTELFSANGFAPEPGQGALITGLLDAVAAAAVPADRLANVGVDAWLASRRG